MLFDDCLHESVGTSGSPRRASPPLPAVKQDLAFVLLREGREATGPELREIRFFDLYRGEQVGGGKKSVALHVSFQSSERTLSDADAAELRARIVRVLGERFGAELRA